MTVEEVDEVKPKPAAAAAAPKPAPPPAAAKAKPQDDDSSSSEDEATKESKLQQKSADAKQRGNDLFAAGDFKGAVTAFSMAIRMDRQNHVLFSNRSGAHCGCGNYEPALADAERCIKLSPKWGKGYGRKGAALTGLGQGGEAVKAYLAGLQVEPGSEALKQGLAEAKQKIREAQGKYEEMWGKSRWCEMMSSEY